MADVVAGQDGLGAQIEIRGFAETMLALSAVDEDMRKEFTKRLRTIGSLVAETARRSAPEGRTGKLKAGYRTRLRTRGSSVKVQVRNDTRQGMILEFAGSASRGKTERGKTLIKTLDDRYGQPGRFMWDAYDVLEPFIIDQAGAAVRQVESDLDARLKGASQ